MLLVLIDDPRMTDTMAITATLLIRFATLWFAVLLGALMLLVLRRTGGSAHRMATSTASVSEGGTP
jgi:hypothetical protein